MRRVAPLVMVLVLACKPAALPDSYGELVVVQNGEETANAIVMLPPVVMTETGTSTLTLRNIGRAGARIRSITRDDDETSIQLDGEGLRISSGSEGVLNVRFSPPQADDVTRLTVTHSARFTVLLEGTAPENNRLELTLVAQATARDCYVPAELDFGLVPPGHAVTRDVTLQNGTLTAARPSWTANTSFFTVLTPSPLAVDAQGRSQLSVRFEPTEARAYEEPLTLSRGGSCPSGVMKLRGTGDDAAITLAPSPVDFGHVPLGDISAREVVVTNYSSVDLDLSLAVTSPSFSIEKDVPTVVRAHSFSTVFLTCRPAALGPLDAELQLQIGTQPEFAASVPLHCTGGGPRIVVNPNPLKFGTVPTDVTTRRRLVVLNTGTPSATNLFLGRDGSLPWFAIVPRNANTRVEEFSVGLIGTYDADAGISAVPGQNSLEFDVTLKPGTPQPREADLLVYSNDSDKPVLTVPMTSSPRYAAPCTIFTDVEAVSFGPTPRGATVTREVHLTNAGNNECLVSSIELAPGSNLAFGVTSPADGTLVIPSGDTRSITVQAAVTNLESYGAYLNGQLRFTVGTDSVSRSLPVSLQVSHCLFIDPTFANLGVVENGCISAGRELTLFNLCNVPIDVEVPDVPLPYLIDPAEAGFITLLGGESATLNATVAPTQSGTWSQQLTFRSIEPGTEVLQNVLLQSQSTPDGIQRDSFTQPAQAVDVLFVIDDSCSMGDEQQALSDNFAAFITAATQGVGDWQIGVTTTDLRGQQGRLFGTPKVLTPNTPDVATAFANNVHVGISGSQYEEPFACMAAALSQANLATYNAGFLRNNAALAVVIITDAVESSPNTTASYVAQLRALKGNLQELVSVSVVGPFSESSATCSVEGIDDGRYFDITTQTNGSRADICAIGSPITLQGISSTVFGARRAFTLSGTARSEDDVTVTIDGVERSTGWRFDTTTNTVVFDSAPTAGQTIVIDYRTACF